MENDFVADIIEFNKLVVGVGDRNKTMLSPEEATFSYKCLNEEADEFMLAYQNGQLIGCIDAILDNIYFAVGILYKMGLSADEIHKCMNIVHTANMTKKFGTNSKRDTGAADAVKPEGWIPPEEKLKQFLFGD